MSGDRALLRLAAALAVAAGGAALASTGGDPALYWPRLAWTLGLAAVSVLALIRPARRDRRGWWAVVLAALGVIAAVLVKFAVTGAAVAWAPAAAAAWTAVTLAPLAARAPRRPAPWTAPVRGAVRAVARRFPFRGPGPRRRGPASPGTATAESPTDT
ncbi:hypothetical protein E1264_15115 [Actinomadura sp. KC216]|uniref:hypothetical protein n=1 Tax=Actinomadura sp. KC216 TaxID=2530370 RepID=UPI0010441680|nr:hypothetical protein [Actinomadura sp. KC216]TDB87337.1 hypothetical protein E1264_15115 [Actinomadura sp. KC216]